MTIALRALILGVALATSIWYLFDPPAPILIVALVVGHLIGFATAWFDDIDGGEDSRKDTKQ